MSTLTGRPSTNARVAGTAGPHAAGAPGRVVLRTPQAVEEYRIHLMKTPAQTKWLSVAAALAVHALILFAGGAALYQPAQFGVQSGIASVDVDLVAAPAEETPVEAPAPPKAEFVAPDAPPAMPIKQETRPQAPSMASAGSDGAIWNEPQYLSNRPPKYPREALINNIEGTAILIANINEKGRPIDVRIEKSSGHASLDASALRAVRQWSFNPARAAGIAVPSRSRIPITFRIDAQTQP